MQVSVRPGSISDGTGVRSAIWHSFFGLDVWTAILMSVPFRSIPFHSVPFCSILFHSVPFCSIRLDRPSRLFAEWEAACPSEVADFQRLASQQNQIARRVCKLWALYDLIFLGNILRAEAEICTSRDATQLDCVENSLKSKHDLCFMFALVIWYCVGFAFTFCSDWRGLVSVRDLS